MSKKTTYRHKNISNVPQTLRGFGTVEAGETVEASFVIENPNFELLEPVRKTTKKTEEK